jgi:hypothetical protein
VRARAALTLLIDMGAPIGLFYLLHGWGLSSFLALLLSGVAPGLHSVYQLARHRRLDGLGAFMVGVTAVSALASLIGGTPRFLLAKDGVVTGIAGVWLLATTRASRPVVFSFARMLLEGRIGPGRESWDELWTRLPRFRHVWRVASVIWGVATILDAAARFVMAYTLPVDVVPGLNGALYAALFVVLQVITNVYYFRAGLYDPRSPMYEPIRPVASARA